MCTLLLVTFPACEDLARLGASPIRLSPAEDSPWAAQLLPGEVPCWVGGMPQCGGGGHCGTVLGREAYDRGRSAEERTEARARKLRRKGWSEHKAQAWLAQKREARPSQPPHLNGGVDELALWNALLRVALGDAHLRFVGLMVYEAGDEPHVPTRTEHISRADCDLTRLEQGVLYRLRA